MLRGFEEQRVEFRDGIGNFEAQHSPRRWEAPLYYPTISDDLMSHDSGWAQTISWPGGKRFAACLTHDVDLVELDGRRDLWRGIALRATKSPDWVERAKSVSALIGLRRTPKTTDIFTPWVQLESSLGFRSTFFVFPTDVPDRDVRDCVFRWDDPAPYRGSVASVREIIRDLHARGCEIGLHGSIRSATDYEYLIREKADLEAALGAQVDAVRQHNLRFDISVTPQLHTRADFRTDSTIGFNRDVGFRSGIAYPHRLWSTETGGWLEILEVPLAIQDGAMLRDDNLGLDEDAAFNLGVRLIDRVAAVRGVVTLLWHPDAVAREVWWNVYQRLLHYIDLQNGWGASVGDIADWWQRRGLIGRLESALARQFADSIVVAP